MMNIVTYLFFLSVLLQGFFTHSMMPEDFFPESFLASPLAPPVSSHDKITLVEYLNILQGIQDRFNKMPLKKDSEETKRFLFLKKAILACSHNFMWKDEHTKNEKTINHPFSCKFLKLEKDSKACSYTPNMKDSFDIMLKKACAHATTDHPDIFPLSKEDEEDGGIHSSYFDIHMRTLENMNSLAKNQLAHLEKMEATLSSLRSTTAATHSFLATVVTRMNEQRGAIKELQDKFARLEGSPFWKGDSDSLE